MLSRLGEAEHRGDTGRGSLEPRGPGVPRGLGEAQREDPAQARPVRGFVAVGQQVGIEAEPEYELQVETLFEGAHRDMAAVRARVHGVEGSAAVEQVAAAAAAP